MRNLKVLLWILILLIFKNLEAQKIVEDIKPEKQFKKLTNYKFSFKSGALDWTPDGKFIIYSRDGAIIRHELQTGKEEVIEYMDGIEGFKLSSSGSKIAYLLSGIGFTSRQMMVIKNFPPKNVLDLKPLPEIYETCSFIWVSNDKKLIFPFVYGNEWNGIGIYDIEKGRLEVIRQQLFYCSIAFNYRNKEFYIVLDIDNEKEKLFLLLFDPVLNRFKKKIAIDILPHVPDVEDINCNGKDVLLTMGLLPPLLNKYGAGIQIVRYSLEDQTLYLLTKGGASYWNVRYSPDCKKIAFFSDRDGFVNIWLLDLEEKK